MIETNAVAAGSTFAVLAWSVKATFCAYVARLADGECQITEGVRLLGEGRYGLPGILTADADGWEWRSTAAVTFSAHGGLLHVAIQAPVIRFGIDGGSLALSAAGGRFDEHSIAGLDAVSQRGNVISAVPMLTPDGAALFGGYYQPGEPLDDLQLILSDGTLTVPTKTKER